LFRKSEFAGPPHFSGCRFPEPSVPNKSHHVILGGSNSYVTAILHGPVALEKAGLVDGVIIGDGEESFPELLRLMAKHRI